MAKHLLPASSEKEKNAVLWFHLPFKVMHKDHCKKDEENRSFSNLFGKPGDLLTKGVICYQFPWSKHNLVWNIEFLDG